MGLRVQSSFPSIKVKSNPMAGTTRHGPVIVCLLPPWSSSQDYHSSWISWYCLSFNTKTQHPSSPLSPGKTRRGGHSTRHLAAQDEVYTGRPPVLLAGSTRPSYFQWVVSRSSLFRLSDRRNVLSKFLLEKKTQLLTIITRRKFCHRKIRW